MLVADNLHKTYRRHANVVNVLQGVDLDVERGEFLSIVGASGSGKSTLLHLLGTLDRPDSGTVSLDGKRIDNLGPRELSGGEMQRTAIARALVARPRILFADEPTGNLDAESGAEIVKLLRSLNQHEGVTILMVTHNLELVRHTDRVVRMAAGKLCDQPPGLPDQLVEAAA